VKTFDEINASMAAVTGVVSEGLIAAVVQGSRSTASSSGGSSALHN